MSTHTPGPWSIGEPGAEDSPNRRMIEPGIGVVFGLGRIPDANARLIAAAPALLKALEAIERRSNCKCEGANDWKCVKCTALAAIAQAKGERQ